MAAGPGVEATAAHVRSWVENRVEKEPFQREGKGSRPDGTAGVAMRPRATRPRVRGRDRAGSRRPRPRQPPPARLGQPTSRRPVPHMPLTTASASSREQIRLPGPRAQTKPDDRAHNPSDSPWRHRPWTQGFPSVGSRRRESYRRESLIAVCRSSRGPQRRWRPPRPAPSQAVVPPRAVRFVLANPVPKSDDPTSRSNSRFGNRTGVFEKARSHPRPKSRRDVEG